MDQFFVRAKLILGLLIAYESRYKNGTEAIKQHKLAVAEIISALDIALHPKNLARYKFLVFDVSVVFWRVVHKFLRSTRAKFFSADIAKVR